VTQPARQQLVDYEQAAARYERGRALSAATLARWREAVAERLPDAGPGVVLDVGAGTGLFLGLWLGLGARAVVAVEPSAAMRAKAAEAVKAAGRALAGVSVVGGMGPHLPARTGSADVVWLSAVVHHLGDLDAAATELRRVLRPSGHLLIRGFAPDQSSLALLEHLPDPERATARFPTVRTLTGVLERAGLAVRDVVDVTDAERSTGDAAADWVAAMRRADSILTALPDDDIERAVASLRSVGTAALPPTSLTLVTAVAR
jgi:ubiquinone/menaquinone biosynthesis C-methylase UbiE